MNAITQRHIIGHLNWNTRARFVLALAVAAALFGSIGYSILKPWDPCGAISLQLLADSGTVFLLRIVGLLLAVGVFATLILDARLPLFGTFAACVGMGIPILKTGGMDYLMVLQQAHKIYDRPGDLWGFLVLETFALTGVLTFLVAGSMITEHWISRNRDELLDEAELTGGSKKTTPISDKPGLVWLKGLGGMALTVVLAIFLIAVLATNIRKGQVVFAAAFGFFVAGLIAEQIAENDHPLWQVAAVPIVAIIAYIYTWFHPDRPAGLESLLVIAPTSLARLLPVEYIFIGTVGAIFGNWTSHRVRYGKEHE